MKLCRRVKKSGKTPTLLACWPFMDQQGCTAGSRKSKRTPPPTGGPGRCSPMEGFFQDLDATLSTHPTSSPRSCPEPLGAQSKNPESGNAQSSLASCSGQPGAHKWDLKEKGTPWLVGVTRPTFCTSVWELPSPPASDGFTPVLAAPSPQEPWGRTPKWHLPPLAKPHGARSPNSFPAQALSDPDCRF